MKIIGLQKTTLVDYPGKIACTLFLSGCNFRCGFCYNPDLVNGSTEEGFSEEDIISFLKERKGKLDAVCITGGEPLLSLDFEFVRKIREMGYMIKLDTNGSFPKRLREMINLGLVDYIAMDIKACPEEYSSVAGVEIELDNIEESIRIIHDFGNYEFRTTIVGRHHDAYKVLSLARWLKKLCGGSPKNFYLQGFKKQESLVDDDYLEEDNVNEQFLEELKSCVREFFEKVEVRC